MLTLKAKQLFIAATKKGLDSATAMQQVKTQLANDANVSMSDLDNLFKSS